MKRFAFALAAAIPLLLAIGTVPVSAATLAHVRLVYLSPDSAIGNIDFYIDGRRDLSNAPYDTPTTYLGIAAGQHTFAARRAGATSGSAPVAEAAQSLDANGYYSVFVGGKVGSTTCPPRAVIFKDDLSSPPAGQVRVNFAHMAPEVPGVDVIQTNAGQPPPVLFSNVSCFQDTAYANVPAKPYQLALVATGTQSPNLFTTSPDLTSDAGNVYTLVGAGGVDQPVSLVVIADAASAGTVPLGGAGTGVGTAALAGVLPAGLVAGSLIACMLLVLLARRAPD